MPEAHRGSAIKLDGKLDGKLEGLAGCRGGPDRGTGVARTGVHARQTTGPRNFTRLFAALGTRLTGNPAVHRPDRDAQLVGDDGV